MSKSPNLPLKQKIIQLGILYGRLTIGEIAEECHEDQEYIKSLLKEMIDNKEILAKYFESSHSIVFEQTPISSITNELNTSTEMKHTTIQNNFIRKMEIGEIFELKDKKYRITKQIGKGGMGRILLAIDDEGTQQIVIKCLLFDRYRMNDLGYNSCEEYWAREQEIIQKQSQSNFPTMHLVGALKGTNEDYYIFLEYIDGISLDKWFPPRATYPDLVEIQSLISDILLPLCNHLAFVHSLNILHRDITPKNIMIVFRDNKITPILIDWGVAKEVDNPHFFDPPKPFFTGTRIQATGIHSVMNPPEILFGLEPVAASDIYMLGGIMFYLFSGGKFPPLPDTREAYILHPRNYNPVLPVKLNDLVVQMTQYEPADRIPQVQKIIVQLRQILTDLAYFPSLQSTTISQQDQDTIVDEKAETVEVVENAEAIEVNEKSENVEDGEIIEKGEEVEEKELNEVSISVESYFGAPLLKSEDEFLQILNAKKGSAIPLITSSSHNFSGVIIQNSHIIVLRLFNQGLTSLPENIDSLKYLQILFLSGNKLTSLPEKIGKLSTLKELYLYNNTLTSLPTSIGNLKSLILLDLEQNRLKSLPFSIGNLKSLQTLWLRGNELSSIPDKIKKILRMLEKQGCKII